MATGYSRQSSSEIAAGQPISAAPLDDEFDAIEAAFNETTGHNHDGTAQGGAKVTPAALASLGGNGIVVRTDASNFTARSVVGHTGHLTVTNGSGVSGNPTITVDAGGITATELASDAVTTIKILDDNVTVAKIADAELKAFAGLTSAANKLGYFTGSGTMATTDFTVAGRAILDDADNTAQRATLGLVIGTDVQAYDATLATIAALNPTTDQSIYFSGTNVAAAYSLTAFARTILDDADAATVRTTLGLTIGTNVQAYDTELAAIAGLVSAADRVPYFTGSGTASLATFTTFGRSLVDDADATAAQTTLGLVIGTNVQAYDAELAAIAGLVSAADRGIYFTGSGTASLFTLTSTARNLLDDTSTSAMLTTLGALAATSTSIGLHTMWIPAGAMVSRTTNGAADGQFESSTNKQNFKVKDFDAATIEYTQFAVRMPKSWNEGTYTALFVWSATNTGNVIWGTQATAFSDDDAYDAAFGTAQTVTDGVTATGDIMHSAATSAVTIAGTPATGDLVNIQFFRHADQAGDTCAVDARLIGVVLFFTTDAGEDT